MTDEAESKSGRNCLRRLFVADVWCRTDSDVVRRKRRYSEVKEVGSLDDINLLWLLVCWRC